jgi:hypothetical protein
MIENEKNDSSLRKNEGMYLPLGTIEEILKIIR